ncbi:MAG: transposase, partial [Sphaerochaeta sp.]|nr:transposase [Sphaerochaeta sp.]
PKGAMGKALDYLYTYKPYMRTYLDVVEATPSNNSCELVAKAFATGRNYVLSNDMFCSAA